MAAAAMTAATMPTAPMTSTAAAVKVMTEMVSAIVTVVVDAADEDIAAIITSIETAPQRSHNPGSRTNSRARRNAAP